MPAPRIASVPAVFAFALALSASTASAELAPWDQAKVTGLAKQLVETTQDLYDTFYKQPTPTAASMQSRTYYQLKQKVRGIRMNARNLANDLKKGADREGTLPIYDSLMQLVRSAREDARKVFTSADVAEKAAAARAVLNQLGPYYDPGFETLQPATP